jgi:hypothetical protein
MRSAQRVFGRHPCCTPSHATKRQGGARSVSRNPKLDTWTRFRGRLTSVDLVALLFEDAAVIHPCPSIPRRGRPAAPRAPARDRDRRVARAIGSLRSWCDGRRLRPRAGKAPRPADAHGPLRPARREAAPEGAGAARHRRPARAPPRQQPEGPHAARQLRRRLRLVAGAHARGRRRPRAWRAALRLRHARGEHG